MSDNKEKKGKKLTGVVVAVSSTNTIKVVVRNLRAHPLYKKTMKVRKVYLVHDENHSCKVGDSVVIRSCKPFSKRKTWEYLETL
jgi:small subunit ribosomal protein S17